MTNVFGEGLDYEIDGEEILNEVEAKLKMMNITNDQKFVNVNELDVINLKYVKKLDYENFKSDYEKYKKENDEIITGYRNKIADLNNQVTEQEKRTVDMKNKFESHLKLFNLLNKNVTKWHGEVEKRFKEISITSFHILNAKRKITETEKKRENILKQLLMKQQKVIIKKNMVFLTRNLKLLNNI